MDSGGDWEDVWDTGAEHWHGIEMRIGMGIGIGIGIGIWIGTGIWIGIRIGVGMWRGERHGCRQRGAGVLDRDVDIDR